MRWRLRAIKRLLALDFQPEFAIDTKIALYEVQERKTCHADGV